jgi:hypothetical protein
MGGCAEFCWGGRLALGLIGWYGEGVASYVLRLRSACVGAAETLFCPRDVGADFPCFFNTAAGGWAGPGH